ncbi:MAG: hypothetical protein KAS60_06385 [Thermoplasmata archaeon]|nr:hypothetical protein [Thermoplasmata archaeon]
MRKFNMQAPESTERKSEKARKKQARPKTVRRMPKYGVYCFIIVLILMNLLFRYPVEITHEVGADTTFIDSLASSLSNEGYAKWVLNPTSLFGLYALSYPSGVPFLLSEFSQMSGVSIEGTIFFFGIVLGIIGALGAFLVSRELFQNEAFAFLVALLFSLAPFFLKDTTWVGSARGSVVALIPIVLWLLIRATKSHDSRFFALSIAIFLVACSLHRMGFLMVFFFISFFFVSSIHKVTQRIRFALVNYERLFRVFGTVLALSGFLFVFYVQILFPGYGGFNIVEVYGRGAFFEGTDHGTVLLNMGVNFVGKVGLAIPIALVGLLLYVWKRPKRIDEKFVLVVILLLVPFLSLRDYISEFLILFFVLMAVFTLVYVQKRNVRWSRVLIVSAVVFLVISVAFSWVMKDYWRDKYVSDTPISESTFDTAMYVETYGDGILLTNFGLMAGRISAMTDSPTLPLGGASTHWHGPQQLIFQTSTSPNLLFFPLNELQTRRLNYDEVTFTTDEVFVPKNAPNALVEWETILRSAPDTTEAENVATKYDIHYVTVSKIDRYRFLSWGWRPSVFLRDIQLPSAGARYKIYENSEETMWFYR